MGKRCEYELPPQERLLLLCHLCAKVPTMPNGSATTTSTGATQDQAEHPTGGPSPACSTYPTKQQKKPRRKLMSPIS